MTNGNSARVGRAGPRQVGCVSGCRPKRAGWRPGCPPAGQSRPGLTRVYGVGLLVAWPGRIIERVAGVSGLGAARLASQIVHRPLTFLWRCRLAGHLAGGGWRGAGGLGWGVVCLSSPERFRGWLSFFCGVLVLARRRNGVERLGWRETEGRSRAWSSLPAFEALFRKTPAKPNFRNCGARADGLGELSGSALRLGSNDTTRQCRARSSERPAG